MTPQHSKGAANVSSANFWHSATWAEVDLGNEREISVKPRPALGIGVLIPEGLLDLLPIFRRTDLRLFRRLTHIISKCSHYASSFPTVCCYPMRPHGDSQA